jgi:hypothetical protein
LHNKKIARLSFVYDHSQGKTVHGYEILTLRLLTSRNFYPVNFGCHFSHTVPAEVREEQPRLRRGDLARRLQEARELTKSALTQGIAPPYLLVDAWFTSPTFCQGVKAQV